MWWVQCGTLRFGTFFSNFGSTQCWIGVLHFQNSLFGKTPNPKRELIIKQRAWRDDWAVRFCWSWWGSWCRFKLVQPSQSTRVLQFDEKEKKERSLDITFTGLDYQFSPWCSKVMFTLNNCNGDDKSALLWFRNWTLVSNPDHSVKRIISKNTIRDGGNIPRY